LIAGEASRYEHGSIIRRLGDHDSGGLLRNEKVSQLLDDSVGLGKVGGTALALRTRSLDESATSSRFHIEYTRKLLRAGTLEV
jgi:hypothetical protein